MKNFIKASVSVIVIVASFCFVNFASADYSWSATNSGSKAWKAIAVAPSNPAKVYAISADTDFIYSLNGNDWDQIGTSQKWTAIDTSANGQTIIASVDGGYIYQSDDSGATWHELTFAGQKNWTAVKISGDAQKIIAVAWAGDIADYNTTRDTWSTDNIHRDNWTTIAGTSDFSSLGIAAYNGSISTNISDAGWDSHNESSGSGCWSYMAATGNGTFLAGDCAHGPIKTSHDGGATWTATNSGNGTWYSVSVSDDGQVIAGADNGGKLIISENGGTAWSEQTSAGSHPWTYAAVSADGQSIFASYQGGPIMKGTFFVPVVLTVPSVTLTALTNVSQTGLTLNGLISNDGGTSTMLTGFNWGADTNYGNTASSSNILATNGTFSETISGLACGTTYHYNGFAENSQGVATSSDATFATLACPGTPDNGTTTPSVQNPASLGGSSGGGGTGFVTLPSITNPLIAAIGDSSNSCIILQNNLRPGSEGPEVVQLQDLLNKFMGSNLAVSGIYNAPTKAAVEAFQTKYADEILAPWGVTTPSGIVSFTTLKKLNELSCNRTFDLSPIEQFLINQYKENPAALNESTTTPTGTPVEVGSNNVAPQETQTAGAADAGTSSGIFKAIANFFKKIF